MGAIELRAEVALRTLEHGPRDGLEQRALRGGHQVPSQQVHAARLVLPRAPRSAIEQRRQLRLHLVEIAHRMLVHDHEVRAKTLQPPVFLRLQGLANEREVITADAHEQDRQIARDAVGPQSALAEHVVGDGVGRRAQ